MIVAPSLKVENLQIVYGNRRESLTALEVAALDVRPGSRLVVTGPSGSGKSTLLYALAGLVRPAAGRVLWDGIDISALSEASRDRWRRRTIGFVFQDFHLLPELGPLANVLLPSSFERIVSSAVLKKRAAGLLEQFGVPSKRASVSDLSRGEQQRVGLARALLFDPAVLLADEPTASLDAASGALVAEALRRAADDEGRTVIVVTHDPALMETIPQRFELERGHVRTAPATENVR